MVRKTPKKGLGVDRDVSNNGAFLSTGLASDDFYLPFFHYLTIPKNTSQTAYISYKLILPIAQIYKVWVEFPSGCAGLAGIQLWRKVEQIFPLPAGVWLRSDNYTLNFMFTHFIDAEPYEVEIRGFNLDDTFSHTIWIGLELRGLPSELSDQLKSFLSALKG